MNQGGKFDRARVQDGQRTIEARTAGVPRWKGKVLDVFQPRALRHEVEGKRTLDHHDAPSALAS